MSRDGIVVGVIHTAKAPDEKPMFEIIRRNSFRTPDPEVRACEHRKFALDEKWATVTCGECKERIDPFAALFYYANNYQEIERRIQHMKDAEKSNHRSELRRLVKLVAATDEDRTEITAFLKDEHRKTVEDFKEIAYRLGRKISDQGYAISAKRRTNRRAAEAELHVTPIRNAAVKPNGPLGAA